MSCNHVKNGYPIVKIQNGEIICSLCGEKIAIGKNEIRSLVKLSTNLNEENIDVIFSEKKKYFYTSSCIGVHEDVYTDGLITETSNGKIFSDFSFTLIIRKNNETNEASDLIIIVRPDEGKTDKTSSEKIIEYLSPAIFDLLL